ncbi:hypothetical protein OESDEN_25033 [Oesophagostomum dentatum]|uniref:Uncharacterized protein n=1 Tax=Oesophagostomum dentatum TaxID=61180 RepID=A0A0B1RUN2_OESDE|nr:hypothetical protein OESDEN_25033 [Oesophagostomum dentatum]
MTTVQFLLLFSMCLTGVCSISLLDAYRSEKQTARRRGMLNVRFRPVMHLRGDDDWIPLFQRKQVGAETLTNQMMDENGIVFDVNPTVNDRVSSIFTGPTGRGSRIQTK